MNRFSLSIQSMSSLMNIVLGVPQGSILGPLLFIIFINDLPYFIKEFTKLFADDTTILLADETVNGLKRKIDEAIRKLDEWCKYNRLYVNWDKTFVMFIKNKRIITPDHVKIDDTIIKAVNKFKLLGVTLDEKLNFGDFIASTF